MISIKVKSTKEFMQKFLMTDAFRDFLFLEGNVITSVSHVLEGRLQKDFFTKEEWEDREICPYEFAQWEEIRPLIFQMIKGKHTPVMMKLTLLQKPELTEKLLRDGGEAEEIPASIRRLIKAFLVTVKYENGGIVLTTGVSYQGFTLDKEAEKRWDKALQDFMDRQF